MAAIGIMGGTFDPIHRGHLMLGRQACEEYHLDQIWFMPSAQPPHKTDHPVTDAGHRLSMVCLAVADEPFFRCSEFEIFRSGKTYTAETLRLLADEHPNDRFSFIIGADSFYEIENWYHPREIMERVPLFVAKREYPGAPCTMEEQARHLEKTYQARIRFLHCEEMDVSSSEIRQMILQGSDIRRLVPDAVAEYIDLHGLYR